MPCNSTVQQMSRCRSARSQGSMDCRILIRPANESTRHNSLPSTLTYLARQITSRWRWVNTARSRECLSAWRAGCVGLPRAAPAPKAATTPTAAHTPTAAPANETDPATKTHDTPDTQHPTPTPVTPLQSAPSHPHHRGDSHPRPTTRASHTMQKHPRRRTQQFGAGQRPLLKSAAVVLDQRAVLWAPATADQLVQPGRPCPCRPTTTPQGFYQSHQATAASVQVNNIHIVRGMLGKPGCGVLQMNGQPTAENTRECGADGARRDSATGPTIPTSPNWRNCGTSTFTKFRTTRRLLTPCRCSATPSRARYGCCGSPRPIRRCRFPNSPASARSCSRTACSSSFRTSS